jgi:hypothetical protein
MKRIVPIALVMIAAASAFLYLRQARQTADRETQAVMAQQRLVEVEAETERQEQRHQSEQARLSAANAQLAEKVARAALAERAAATNGRSAPPTPDATNLPHPMAEMLRDPDMRAVFRKQAAEAVARQVKELVNTNLIQKLGLNQEQTIELKKLLGQRGTLGFNFLMPVMTGELDETGLAELGRRTKADMATLTDELKTLLGEEGFKTLAADEKSQPDRDRLEKLEGRLKQTGQSLTPEQRSQLLAAMSEERNHFQFAIDYSDTSQIDFEHFNELYTEEKMDHYFNELQSLNDLILQRTQSILSAEQAAELQELLKVQLQKSKYVIKTTNAMLGKRAAR